jgi:hypothetical protein
MFDFKETVDKLDDVPAEFRCFYEDKNGVPTLLTENPVVKSSVAALNGLHGALTNARKQADTAGARLAALKPLEALGPIEELANIIPTKLKELETQLAKKANFDPEEAKRAIAESMKGEITNRDTKIGALQQALNKHLIHGQTAQALAKHNGIVDLAMPHVLSRLRVEEDNGDFGVVVLDDAGKIAYSKKRGGERMNVEEFVEEMSQNSTYAPLFRSTQGSGGGSHRENQRNTTPPPSNGSQMTSREKIAAGLRQMG